MSDYVWALIVGNVVGFIIIWIFEAKEHGLARAFFCSPFYLVAAFLIAVVIVFSETWGIILFTVLMLAAALYAVMAD